MTTPPPAKGSNKAHAELVNATLLKLGALPYCRCWPRVVGIFYRVRFDQMGKVCEAIAVTVGTEGEPDIDGILTRWDGVGQRFGVECKTGNAVQNEAQRNYMRMIRSMGGIYILARTPDEALDLLERERVKGKRVEPQKETTSV
jgi:hypothetical protein